MEIVGRLENIKPFYDADCLPVTSQKIPSVLSYEDKRTQWGYQVNQSRYPGKQRQLIQGVKLLLDETQKYSYGPASDSEETLKEMEKTPVQVSGDYLGKVVAHDQDILTRRFGAALQITELQYILTVPALWSDKAKDNTKQAALWAGIPSSNLRLLSRARGCCSVCDPHSTEFNCGMGVRAQKGNLVNLINFGKETVWLSVMLEEAQL